MNIKTSELGGALLNSFVAKCEGLPVHPGRGRYIVAAPLSRRYADEFDFLAWKDGGPIIERENITLIYFGVDDDRGHEPWEAQLEGEGSHYIDQYHGDAMGGSTPLIAAMRAYVASKLGDEVEIDETKTGLSPITTVINSY